MILTWLILIPIIAGVLGWSLAKTNPLACRYVCFLACVLDLLLAVYVWLTFPVSGGLNAVMLESKYSWIPQFGISYHLALDGLSLLLIVLTALLGITSVAVSWKEIQERVGFYHFCMMLLLAGIIGVFLAFDLILFYLFWELMLIPMYFLIGIWGHENRVYAAVKFFIFTFLGGLLMLLAIIGIYLEHGNATGVYTYDYLTILASRGTVSYSMLLMLGFFVAFAIKLPALPLHSWLPDAHTEAPTAGSVILAGLMLKTGAYGLMRFAIPLFPEASIDFRLIAMAIGAAGVVYGAVMAYSQHDFKRMVAYTSVSHMGFVLIGLYAGSEIAIQGVVIQLLSHGVSTGALFMLAGMIQERTHTRDLYKLGGLWAVTPKLSGMLLLFALASMGLPAMGNFVAEFMILLGAYKVSPVITIVAATGLVFSCVYALKLVQRTILGPNDQQWSVKDLGVRELAELVMLAALILWLGIYPKPVFDTARSSVQTISRIVGADAGEVGSIR